VPPLPTILASRPCSKPQHTYLGNLRPLLTGLPFRPTVSVHHPDSTPLGRHPPAHFLSQKIVHTIGRVHRTIQLVQGGFTRIHPVPSFC
jgi:hypothetical protein